jgi:CBS domain-containing protein
MRIREIMKRAPDLVTCAPTDSVMDAAKKMERHNVGCVLITEGGRLKGILTDRDITLSVVAKGKVPGDTRVRDVMHTHVLTGGPDWDLLQATQLMAEKKIRRLPIQSNGTLEGFVSLADLAPAVQKEIDSFFAIEAAPAGH